MTPNMKIAMSEYHAILRHDFHAFIQRCVYELDPNVTFLPNWHLEVMAAKLAQAPQIHLRFCCSGCVLARS
jgi:hypothetical protein